MDGDDRTTERAATRWDRVAEELQALRRAAGEPSFAELARRVAERRMAAGIDEHAARVARTTVYDAFRTGRARVNVPLVRDIVATLGGDERAVDAWLAAPTPPVAMVETAAPAPRPTASARFVLAALVGCVVVNLLGRALVDLLELPVYLDMVGTAVAVIALGPWHGAAVGLTTNLAGTMSSGAASIPFALVNVAGALVWGYGVRRWRLGRTLPRFLGLNVLVALTCSLVAVPIIVLVFGGTTGHGSESIRQTLLSLTDALVVATGFANLLASLGDKVLAGFLALVAVSALPPGTRIDAELPLATGSVGDEVGAGTGRA